MMQSGDNLMEDIQGVDYEGAMVRMSDNAVFYAELLRLFFNDNILDRLEAAICGEDYTSAIYEAHSLKGTAANLGLTEISQLAAKIHVCLKENKTVKAKLLMKPMKDAYFSVSSIVERL